VNNAQKRSRLKPAFVGGLWHLVSKDELLSVLEECFQDPEVNGMRKANLDYLRALITQTWDR